MEQFKGTAENPFTMKEFQGALISNKDLITITIIANRKSKTVRVIDEGTNREELKSIITDVMRQINSRSF